MRGIGRYADIIIMAVIAIYALLKTRQAPPDKQTAAKLMRASAWVLLLIVALRILLEFLRDRS